MYVLSIALGIYGLAHLWSGNYWAGALLIVLAILIAVRKDMKDRYEARN